MSSKLEKRLARIEQTLADLKMKDAHCICKVVQIFMSEEQERDEMSRRCPAHEHRQDKVIRVELIGVNCGSDNLFNG